MGFPHRLVQVHASFWMFFLFSFMVIVHFPRCPLPLPGQLTMRIQTRHNDTDPTGPRFTTLGLGPFTSMNLQKLSRFLCLTGRIWSLTYLLLTWRVVLSPPRRRVEDTSGL
jgi:hypothetical protein